MKGFFLRITVNDWQKHAEGISTYTTYKVNSSTNMDTYNKQQDCVVRRFSDFVWLQEQLIEEYPGMIVPPMPEKTVVGRFTPDFIESRMRALQSALNRIAVHSELMKSESLRVFLQGDDQDLAFAKQKAEQRLSLGGFSSITIPEKANTALSWLGSSAVSSWNAVSNLAKGQTQVKSPEDKKFDELQEYINNLESHFDKVARHSSNIIRKEREHANALYEFSMVANLLASHEQNNDAEVLGEAMAQLANATDMISVVESKEAEDESLIFEDPINEYVRIIQQAKHALQQREDANFHYHNCLADLDGKEVILNRVQGVPGKEDKEFLAKANVERAREEAQTAKEQLEIISSRVTREIQRFKREKTEDMRRIITEFVKLHIEYSKQVQRGWTDLLPKIEVLESLGYDSTTTTTISDNDFELSNNLDNVNLGTTTKSDFAFSEPARLDNYSSDNYSSADNYSSDNLSSHLQDNYSNEPEVSTFKKTSDAKNNLLEAIDTSDFDFFTNMESSSKDKDLVGV